MSNTTYAYFDVYNHTGSLGISSYALPFCKFQFVLDLDTIENEGVLSNQEILWDYGDGTTGTSLTGSHTYTDPGAYQVTCYLYDNNGEAYLNTYARTVQVINFVTDMVSLSVSNTTNYTLTAGKITLPILVTRTNSYQDYSDDQNYTIVPYASGSTVSQNYFDSLSSQLYGHLGKYSSFYVERKTRAGDTELVEVENLNIEGTKLYCKLVSGEVIFTKETDVNAFFCGTSGSELVYFKDDIPSNQFYMVNWSVAYYTLTGTSIADGTIINYPFWSKDYEFDTNSTTEPSFTAVDISADQSLSAAAIAWVNALTAYESGVFTYYYVSGGTFAVRLTDPSAITFFSGSTTTTGAQVMHEATLSPNSIGNDTYVRAANQQPVNLYFGFDPDIFTANTATLGLSAEIQPNRDYSALSITSNGIDGEGSQLSTFDLNTNKFAGQKVHFVAKVKDSDWYTIKDVEFTGYTNTLYVTTTTWASLPSIQALSATFVIQSSANGYLKGYVIPHEPGNDVYIDCAVSLSSNNSLGASLTGQSTKFNVLGTQNRINTDDPLFSYTEQTFPALAKQGEDVDMLQNYKDLRFQELFLDQINLFDNFLGSIVGTISSDQTSIGKKVYEKISNFVDNHGNITKCDLPQLISMLQSVDEQNVLFEKANFNYPTELKRLINLLSINHSRLFGTTNKFNKDFYNYGNSLQGKNLGNKITTLTYTITAGTPIVALERYSGKFKLLNTQVPLSAASLSASDTTYPLSAYSADWGWYLILNNSFQATDLDKFYTFFEFKTNTNPEIEESVINFDDGNTTLAHTTSSYPNWVATNGTMESVIAYTITRGLNLVGDLT
jgi:hypothetical protein